MKRTRTILAVLAPLGAIAALVCLSACPANPAPTLYEPITGVILDSEGLTAGVGCGTADDQVFEYAAVATLAPDAAAGVSGLPVSGVFPCYANGQLANLPSPDGGTFDYVIKIYAWNQASFPAAELGGCDDLPADASCQGENPTTVMKYAPTADWTTTCTVTQVVGVSEVATCGALVRNLDASLAPDTGTEAGVVDGSADGPGEAGEAGEAGGVEGGMPTDGAADGAEGGGSPITDGGDGG